MQRLTKIVHHGIVSLYEVDLALSVGSVKSRTVSLPQSLDDLKLYIHSQSDSGLNAQDNNTAELDNEDEDPLAHFSAVMEAFGLASLSTLAAAWPRGLRRRRHR